jgi:hypothetical protein
MKRIILLVSLLAPAISFAQSYSIDWYQIAGGGGTSAGGGYQLRATIGQPGGGGAMAGGGYSLSGGFWSFLSGVRGSEVLAPVISSIPSGGTVGAAIVISGENLTGATAVTFDGVAAGFVVNSATQITATVPAGATSGPISVTTPGGTAQSTASFAILAAPSNGQLIGGAFIKGVNLPWIDGDYYNDIAVDPHYPDWGAGYSSSDMNRYLADIHSMGVPVVRFWLNQDDQGCAIDSNGYVTSVTDLFWSNLDDIVSLAGNNGVSLYLTLNDGRVDWLTNTAMAAAYMNICLVPMIERYKGNNAVFGIDLMNEIDGQVGDPALGNWTTSGATWAQAQAYITTFASAVHSADPNRLVSCSTGWHQWYNLSYFKGLGLDFYDFHEYEDTISLPLASSLGMDKPIYIGECGQSYGDTNWSDSLQNTCELEALDGAWTGGYAGAGIWAYLYPSWSDSPQYSMLNADGSWRPVCFTIQGWKYGPTAAISRVPPSGAAGTQIVIAGQNLAEATEVTFNGVPASFTVNSATQITATVPSGATSGPISVTTPAGTAQSATSFTVEGASSSGLAIYVDSLLNGFQDNSWATNVNYQNTSPVYSGSYSISVTAASYTAMWLYHDNFSTAPYGSLNFWINGGAAGAQGLQVMGVVEGAAQAAYSLPALAANTWTEFNIPLSALGVANIADCQGFWFWPTLSGTTTFYVDSVQLNNATAPTLAVVPSAPKSGSFVFELSGIPGETYWIQTSTDLINWASVSTNVMGASSANVTNAVIPTSSHQFWRAISQE